MKSATAALSRQPVAPRSGVARPRPAHSARQPLQQRVHAAAKAGAAQSAEDAQSVDLQSAMRAARQNAQAGLSPGAGLATAEEQAEAAYADLINTSVDLTGSTAPLPEDLISDLEAGGNMATAEEKGHKLGLLGDALQLWGALSGGAHIVRQEDGRI